MSQAEQTLISLLLPEGILDYFEIMQVEKVEKMLNIYLEEKNIAPEGYDKQALESKGFFQRLRFRIFPFAVRKSLYALKDGVGQLKTQDQSLVEIGI